MKYADIILPVAVPRPFTYALGAECATRAAVGQRVVVPVGKSATAVGIIDRLHDDPPSSGTEREVQEIIDREPIVTPPQIELWRWMAQYYMCALGEVSKAALPRGILQASYAPPTRKRTVKHTPPSEEMTSDENIAPILKEIHDSQNTTTLFYGDIDTLRVELYIALIREAAAAGRQSLLLLSEASSPTAVAVIRALGSERVVKYFGTQTEMRRSTCYMRLRHDAQSIDLVIGSRTALFLPFDSLGQVIIDGESDSRYYRPDPAPRYHARDTALVLAHLHNARTLLAARCPALESYYNAARGKYNDIYVAPKAASVKVTALERGKGLLSRYLHAQMGERIAAGQQVVLFQNRRGFSPYVECTQCGAVPECPQCSVTLTYHKQSNSLECHYCGIVHPYTPRCPSCGGDTLVPRGIGTERIEEQVRVLFPTARVDRLDTDSASSRTKAGRILGDFSQQQTDILVGTQMLSRTAAMGHVGLVGVINADNMLAHPDFRAAERAYGLLMQLAALINVPGGEIVIQGSQRDSRVVQAVADNDTPGFYEAELAERLQMLYPPAVRMIRLELRHPDAAMVDQAASELFTLLRPLFGNRISAPFEPQIDRIMGQNLRQMILRIERTRRVERAKALLGEQLALFNKRFSKLRIIVVVDPQ